jgi:hypothetical protein
MNRRLALLVVLVAIGCITMLLVARADTHGLTTSDSSSYLRHARLIERSLTGGALLDGPLARFDRETLSVWPLGYSTLIAFVDLLVPGSVWAASKLVQCAAAVLLVFGVCRLFSTVEPLAAGVLFFPAVWRALGHTWSELLFVALLIHWIAAWSRESQQPSRATWIQVALLSAMLPLIRYSGAIVLIGLAGLSLSALVTRRELFARRVLVTFVAALPLSVQLLWNLRSSGHWTGIARSASSLSVSQLSGDLARELVRSLNLLMPSSSTSLQRFWWTFVLSAVILGVGIAWSWRTGRREGARRESAAGKPERVALAVAAIYGVWITILAGSVSFDPLDDRLLLPVTVPLMVAGLSCWLRHDRRTATAVVGSLAAGSFLIHGPIELAVWQQRGRPSYAQTIEATEHRYRELPKPAVIAFATAHVSYLELEQLALDPRAKFVSQPLRDWLSQVERECPCPVLVDIPAADFQRFQTGSASAYTPPDPTREANWRPLAVEQLRITP